MDEHGMEMRDYILDGLGRVASFTLVWPDGMESDVEQIWGNDDKLFAVKFDGRVIGDLIAVNGKPGPGGHLPK